MRLNCLMLVTDLLLHKTDRTNCQPKDFYCEIFNLWLIFFYCFFSRRSISSVSDLRLNPDSFSVEFLMSNNKSVALCQINSNEEDFTALLNQIACIPRDSNYTSSKSFVEVCLADKQTFSHCTAETPIKEIVKTRNQALNLQLSARHCGSKLYSDRKVQVEMVNGYIAQSLLN